MTRANYSQHQAEFIAYVLNKYPDVCMDDLKSQYAINFEVWHDFAKFPKIPKIDEGMFVGHGYQTYYIYNKHTDNIFYSEAVSIDPTPTYGDKKFIATIKQWRDNAEIPWT